MQRFIKQVAISLLALFCIAACTPSGSDTALESGKSAKRYEKAVYPQTTFAVISDLHLYDSSLGTSGSAFQAELKNDRKLLKESAELLDATINRIADTQADFVLVCGDLTKDGEATNHKLVAQKLKRLTDTGKKVLVTPGNHDIRNFKAYRYERDKEIPVDSVSAGEFADLYREFGYREALHHDAVSLSYVAEPVDGLWVLSLDSCRYEEQEPGSRSITAGAIPKSTFQWIERILTLAADQQKATIAFLHHGILEHYPGNEKYYERYLVDNYEEIAELLSGFGVVLVFSGHFHAQDITAARFEDPPRTIYDIETGSIVTYPCPYRIVTVSTSQKVMIRSHFIRAIPSREEGFRSFARNDAISGTEMLADKALLKYGVSEKDRKLLNPQIARAFVTHLQGDETKPEIALDKAGTGLWGRFVATIREGMIEGWYTDLPPADNDITIDLVSGRTIE